jgi:uncharacterized protein YjbJ (UPF0337 family)
VLYPLSYEGGERWELTAQPCLPPLRGGNPTCMTAMRKARNEFDRIVGRAKEEFGEATGNARLRDEGRTDQVRARLRKTGERVKDRLRGRRY